MFSLAVQLPQNLYFEGRRYKLNTSFDAMLRIFALQRDQLFSPMQRIETAVEILNRKATRLPVLKKVEFFNDAISMLTAEKHARTAESGPRSLDFEQDAAYIYAGFLQAYGIDLLQQAGKLDWRCFVALFQGLPDTTKIKEIISIRRRPIPALTKYNAAEIKSLMEAKAFFAVRLSEEESQEMFQRGVDRLAASLVSRAQSKGGG